MSLLGQLCLQHQPSFSSLIEEIGPVGEPIVTELLGDALRIGSLGSLLNEVVKEAEDLVVKALQTVILVIVELLGDRVVVAL